MGHAEGVPRQSQVSARPLAPAIGVQVASQSCYSGKGVSLTANELKRKLERLGCSVAEGTKHWIVYYKGNRTTVPRHPGKEIKTRTYYSILRELKIKGN